MIIRTITAPIRFFNKILKYRHNQKLYLSSLEALVSELRLKDQENQKQFRTMISQGGVKL